MVERAEICDFAQHEADMNWRESTRRYVEIKRRLRSEGIDWGVSMARAKERPEDTWPFFDHPACRLFCGEADVPLGSVVNWRPPGDVSLDDLLVALREPEGAPEEEEAARLTVSILYDGTPATYLAGRGERRAWLALLRGATTARLRVLTVNYNLLPQHARVLMYDRHDAGAIFLPSAERRKPMPRLIHGATARQLAAYGVPIEHLDRQLGSLEDVLSDAWERAGRSTDEVLRLMREHQEQIHYANLEGSLHRRR